MKRKSKGGIFIFFALAIGLYFGMTNKGEEEDELTVVDMPAEEMAELSCAQPSISFGSINESDGPVEHQFQVTNTGKYHLLLISCEGSCGCTTVDWTREPIEPGGTGIVTVTYDPKGESGTFIKHIKVISNAKAPLTTLTIQGEVINK